MADEFDPDAYLNTFNPDEYLAQPAQKPASGDDASWWSGAATAIPAQMAKAAGTTAEVLAKGFGPESRSKQGAVESLLNTGAALAEIPTAPLRQAAAVVTPALGAVSHQIGKWINPEVAKTDVPQETYDRLAPGVETALGAAMPTRVRLPATPRPTANAPLGVVLTEGEQTGKLPLLKRETAALRDQTNPKAHEHAREFADQRTQQLETARDTVARDMDPAGQRIAETPQQAGEMVSQGLRANAKAAKSGVDSAYEYARSLPGEVHAGAFEGIAPKIKWELSNRAEPIIIDELTPRASKALDYITERVANLNIKNKADPFGQPNPENITGVSLEGIDQWRKNLVAMRRDAYSSGNAPDGRAISAVVKEFDNTVDAAINGGLFAGDPRAVDAWNAARKAHSDYRSMFKKGKNDPVGAKIEKIIGNETNAPAIGSEVAAFLGGDGGKITTEKMGVARRLREVLGETSMEWSAIKQGQWGALTEGVTPRRAADNIEKFLGTPMAAFMYSQGSRDAMKSYADVIRQITTPQAAGQWSNNAPFMNRIRAALDVVVGMGLGHASGYATGIPYAGEIIGAGLAAVRQGRAATKEARQVEKQMPILADQVRKWQEAQQRALKRQTPGTVKSLSSAYNALDRSLRHLETIGQRLQSPVASPAEGDQQQSPRPPAEQKNGGKVDGQKGFAHGGRVVASNIDHAPTEAQKKAGNYAKDHVRIQGLEITVENAKGKFRRGVGKDGKPWAVKMPAHYGYLKRSEGADKDHVDVYIGSAPNAPKVFVVDQKDADTGKFDEHKAFVGFGSKAQVVAIYRRCFNDGKADKRLGHIAEMSPEQFRAWLDNGDTTKPVKQMADGGRVAFPWVEQGNLSPHEAAALRVRRAVKPGADRKEVVQ